MLYTPTYGNRNTNLNMKNYAYIYCMYSFLPVVCCGCREPVDLPSTRKSYINILLVIQKKLTRCTIFIQTRRKIFFSGNRIIILSAVNIVFFGKSQAFEPYGLWLKKPKKKHKYLTFKTHFCFNFFMFLENIYNCCLNRVKEIFCSQNT